MKKKFLEDMIISKRKREEEINRKEINGIKKKEITIKKINKEINIKDDDFNNNLNINNNNLSIEENEENKKGKSVFLWILALFLLAFLFIAFSSFFSKAYIEINPKIIDVSLNNNLIAYKDLLDKDNRLSYQLMSLEEQEEVQVKALDKVEVNEKAKGTVILYNNFSNKSQNLDKDTRLEGSNGKIYKITQRITIPGMSSSGLPGQTEVSIYAEKEGEEYNSPPLDFLIVGFKNSSKYDKFYGRSKGEIKGGFVGLKKILDETEKEKVTEKLENSLESKLLRKAINQVPEGYVLFNKAISTKFSYEVLENEDIEHSTIKMKGTLYAILFDKNKLKNEIIKIKLIDEVDKNLYILNIKDIEFSLLNKVISFENLSSINFKLEGQIKVVSYVEEEVLLNDLYSKRKKDFNHTLSKYDNISSANLKIKPFWLKKIPEEAKRIKMIINYPN